MKNQIASALMALLLTGALATAQTRPPAQIEDWHVVENLPQRTLISVEDLHHVIHDKCRFQSVVDDQLFCEYSYAYGSSEVVFHQESIRAVRREHNGTLAGLAIGAGAGAVIGAAADSSPRIGRGGSAIVGAGIYGAFGAIIGSAHSHFSHGKIIYQQSTAKPPTSGSLPTDRKTTSDSPAYLEPAERIAAARTPYTQPGDVAAETDPHLRLAQYPGCHAGPRFSSGGAYPGPIHAPMWVSPNGRHALIGAIIGGLLGAAVSTKGKASAGATFAITSLGTGLGAAIGISIPPYPGPQVYPRRWQDGREEASRPSSVFGLDPSLAENEIDRQPNRNRMIGIDFPSRGIPQRAEPHLNR